MSPNIVLIGAGNLATQLGSALKKAGFRIVQVYSRTRKSAEELALKLGCESTDSLGELARGAEVYLFSVKDDILESLLTQRSDWDSEALYLHTAGSMPMDVFRDKVQRYGVWYPLQTFSKYRTVDFAEIPCFIEGSSPEVLRQIRQLAQVLSTQVYEIDSAKRKHLHLAAVFACNFTNHLYAVAAEILQKQQIPFSVMLPLIEETVRKVGQLSPVQAQTGPALRYDRNVMNMQLELIKEHSDLQEIYRLLSVGIYKKNNNNDGKY